MKNIYHPLLFFLLLIAGTVFAQQPEKIYGKNRVLKSNEYYLQQMELWKKEVEKHPKNADAWFNYYSANRASYIVGEEKDSLNTKGINRFERLKKIVDGMEKNVPNSFEYNYTKWTNGNNDPSLFPYLEKAHQIAPERTEPLMSMVYYYETQGDYTLKAKYAKQYYEAGEFSPALLNYGYNMLVGLEPNAIIFTEGDKDTDAILLLQNGKGLRPDVQLINLNLLLDKTYRERIFKELGIPPFELDPMVDTDTYEKYRASIIGHFTNNKNNRPVYVAVTVTWPHTKDIQENLYITGLQYLFSTTKIDHIALLERNLGQLYALDYLKVYFPQDMTIGMVHRFNQNYYRAFSALYQHYLLSGEASKAAYYKNLAAKIAEDYGNDEEFLRFF